MLVVLGGEPLDILEQWVKALFLAVPSGRGPRPVFDHLGRPYTVQHSPLIPDTAAPTYVLCPLRLGAKSGLACMLMRRYAGWSMLISLQFAASASCRLS